MSRNQAYELFKLDIDLPIHSLYRRVQIDDSHGFFFRMTTDGQITLTPYTTDVGRILRTFKIKKNVEVTDNGKIII